MFQLHLTHNHCFMFTEGEKTFFQCECKKCLSNGLKCAERKTRMADFSMLFELVVVQI